MNSPNEFQRISIQEVERIFSEIGASWPGFQRIEGKSEPYLKMIVSGFSQPIDVYIYRDEAGYMTAGKWHPFERHDYQSTDELRAAFLTSLKTEILRRKQR